jgi:aldose 1-epimerase
MPFETIVTGEPGHPVITLTDQGTGCQAEIYGFGGLLNAFRVPHNSGLINVIDGFSSVKMPWKTLPMVLKAPSLAHLFAV